MKIIKWGWICLSIAILIVTLFNYDGGTFKDIDMFFVLAMEAISFPLGLLYAYAFGIWQDIFVVTIQVSYCYFIVSWTCIVILGYVQWFIAIPWVINKFKAKND